MTDQRATGVMDRVGFAVTVMVLTDLTLSIADALIKATLAAMPLSQFIFLRSVLTIPLLVLIVRLRYPGLSLRPVRPGWAALRSAMLLASLLLYYAALPQMDLSMAAAAYYTIPLFITLFSAVLVREVVGPRGWVGVAFGFAGVLLMLKPEAGALNLHALMPLGAALLYALAMVVTRTKARSENAFVLALVFNLIALVIGGVATLASLGSATAEPGLFAGPWLAMGVLDWALILFLTCTMIVGSVGTAVAYQSAPSAIVSTWDFSYLAFSVVWGVLIFSERLDLLSALGIAMIVTAGLLVIRRPTPAG